MKRFALNALVICFALSMSSCHPGSESKNNSQTKSDGKAVKAGPSASAAPASTNESKTAEEVLRQMADFYKAAKTIQVDVKTTIHVEAQGIESRMKSTTKLTAERPNKIALRAEGSVMGADVVSDGEKMFVYVPSMKRYSEEPAPESFDELSSNPIAMLVGGGGLGGIMTMSLLASDPYKLVMEGVTSTEDLGTTMLDDVSVRQLKGVQDQFTWEAWVATGERPLLQKILMDMSQTAGVPGAPAGMKMSTILEYRDWKIDAPPSQDAFVFVRPEGAEKSDDLFGNGGEEEPSPLLGMPAPPVKLSLLVSRESPGPEHGFYRLSMRLYDRMKNSQHRVTSVE